jgi:hypothetical protein
MIRQTLLMVGLGASLSISALAQTEGKVELGLKGGVGTYTARDLSAAAFGDIGAEVCAFCAGRFALFGEYSHWLTSGNQASQKAFATKIVFGGPHGSRSSCPGKRARAAVL